MHSASSLAQQVNVQWWSKVLTHHADFSNSEGLGCKLLNFWSRTSESG